MKKLLIVVFLFAGIFYLYQTRLPLIWIGQYLSPNDGLSKSDVIVVVSGSGERVKYAVKLYKKDLAPKLIFSGAAREGPSSNALVMKNYAVKQGVPENAIILEEEATNTLENAKYSSEIILKEGFKKIILVTSPYHQRRTFEIFREVLKKDKVGIKNSPTNESRWKVDNWWKTEPEATLTKSEIVKLLWSKLNQDYYQ